MKGRKALGAFRLLCTLSSSTFNPMTQPKSTQLSLFLSVQLSPLLMLESSASLLLSLLFSPSLSLCLSPAVVLIESLLPGKQNNEMPVGTRDPLACGKCISLICPFKFFPPDGNHHLQLVHSPLASCSHFHLPRNLENSNFHKCSTTSSPNQMLYSFPN